MQPHADVEGHILLQPGPHATPGKQLFQCTWESENDKLERVTQVLSLLATVQQVFNHVRSAQFPSLHAKSHAYLDSGTIELYATMSYA